MAVVCESNGYGVTGHARRRESEGGGVERRGIWYDFRYGVVSLIFFGYEFCCLTNKWTWWFRLVPRLEITMHQ